MTEALQWVPLERRIDCLSDEVGELKGMIRRFLAVSGPSVMTAMVNARQCAEFVVGSVLAKENLEIRRDLLDNIETLGGSDPRCVSRRGGRSPILPRPLYSLLHNLRIYGNEVAHPFGPRTMAFRDVRLGLSDLQIALAQLLKLVEWYCTEYLAPPIDPLYRALPEPLLGRFADTPPDVAGFLGRTNELAEMARLLGDPQIRCILVIAPGGTGKTLLAAQAAHRTVTAEASGTRLLWFDLRHDPPYSEVSDRLLASLDEGGRMGAPEIAELSSAARTGLILRRLHERSALVVLDNLDAWIDPAAGRCRDVSVAGLLEQAAAKAHRGKFIVTSRVAPGEVRGDTDHVRTVSLGGLSSGDAVQLLRSRGIRGDDSILSDACARSGNNPRIILYLADHVRQRFQRDLAAGLARQPELVEKQGRRLFEEILTSISPTARQVLGALALAKGEASADEIVDLVGVLGTPSSCDEVDRVLWDELIPRALVALQESPPGFRVEHPLMRTHAREMFADVIEVHRRLASHYRAQIHSVPEAPAAYLPAEKAIHHALQAGDEAFANEVLLDSEMYADYCRWGMASRVDELLSALCERFPLDGRGQAMRLRAHRKLAAIRPRSEAIHILLRCRDRLGNLAESAEEARICGWLCEAFRKTQQFRAAEEAGLRAVDLATRLRLGTIRVLALLSLAGLRRAEGKPREAAHFGLEAEGLAGEAGDPELRMRCCEFLGKTYASGGDRRRARQYFDAAISEAKARGETRLVAETLGRLASLERAGNVRESVRLAREAITLRRQVRDRSGEAIDRAVLGLSLLALGDREGAFENLKAALETPFELGHAREVAARLLNLGWLHASGGTFPEAVACHTTALGLYEAWGIDMRKGRRRLGDLERRVGANGGDWGRISADVDHRRTVLLEMASGIPAARWAAFLEIQGTAEPALAERLGAA